MDRNRAQASLPALAIALLILAGVTVLSLAVANGALATAERNAGERHVATSVADRLVAADGPVSMRQNVLDRGTLENMNASTLRRDLSVVDDEAVQVSVGGRPVVSAPDARGGTTVRRIVVLQRTERRSITPALGPSQAVTLPRRTSELVVDLDPSDGTTVHTVTANGHVLLRNGSGLAGRHEVELSRFETARLRFVGPGRLQEGDLTLEYPIARTTRATLAVTVDG